MFLSLSLYAHINFQYKLNFYKFFLICKFTVFLFLNFSLHILWKRINEFSPWQFLFFCLISIQQRVNKHKLFSIFNTKSTYKLKTSKIIFYLKNKLNQFSIIALPDWWLLSQVSENAIRHAIISWYLENYSIFTS